MSRIIWYIFGIILLQITLMHDWNSPFSTHASRCAWQLPKQIFFCCISMGTHHNWKEKSSYVMLIVLQGYQIPCRSPVSYLKHLKGPQTDLPEKEWGRRPPLRWNVSIKDDHLSSLVQRHHWPYCGEAQYCQGRVQNEEGQEWVGWKRGAGSKEK